MSESMVDAAPVRDYVRGLVAEGMSQLAICRAADVTPAALQALLHGQYGPGRPPQKTIYAPTADRLLAVQFEAPAPRGQVELLCPPGDGFEPAGHRVGRCLDCGQLAPVRRVPGEFGERDQMIGHPRLVANGSAEKAPAPASVAAAAGRVVTGRPEHGTIRGHARHRRANEQPCELCMAAKRGYEHAVRTRPKPTGPMVSKDLAKALLALCRAIVLHQPVPRIRELAAHALTVAAATRRDVGAEESEAA